MTAEWCALCASLGWYGWREPADDRPHIHDRQRKRRDCGECGGKVVGPSQCSECYGTDDYGVPFCPTCDFCCGC